MAVVPRGWLFLGLLGLAPTLLNGLRVPESGLLLLRGLDRQTIGSGGWRRRVVAAPQFHENHVLTETFAFNLLMRWRWPPQSEDVEAA
jgi:ATP-binding cassette subfamily B protein